jgi:hypothetical protein
MRTKSKRLPYPVVRVTLAAMSSERATAAAISCLLALWCGTAAAAATPSPAPATSEAVTPSASPSPIGPPGTYDVPTSDCSATTDSTSALETFVTSVPNGSIIVFPPGAKCYVQTSIDLSLPPSGASGRSDTTFDLNGATIFRTTEPTCAHATKCNAPLVRLDQVTNVTLKNGAIRGGLTFSGLPHYEGSIEHDHGVTVHGDSGVTLSGLAISNVGGDCVDTDVYNRIPSTNISYVGTASSPFSCTGTGRQGISANGVDGLVISGVQFDLIAETGVDLEPRKHGYIKNTVVRGCRFGWMGHYAIEGHGSGSVWSDVTIEGNAQTDPAHPGLGFFRTGNSYIRGPVTITGNRSYGGYQITNTTGTGTGNTLLAGGGVTCMFGTDSSGRFRATGNAVPAGVQQVCVIRVVHVSKRSLTALAGIAFALAVIAFLSFTLLRRRRRSNRTPAEEPSTLAAGQ